MTAQSFRPFADGHLGAVTRSVSAAALPIIAACLVIILTACGKTNLTEAEYIQRAERHLAAAEYQASIIEFRNALKRNPDNAGVRKALAELYVRLENGAAAEEQLRWISKAGVDDEATVFLLGQALALQGKFEELLAEVPVSTGGTKIGKADILALRGTAHLGLRQVPDARRAIEQAARMAPDSSLVLTAQIRLAAADRDGARAQALLTRALARHGNQTRFWVLQGHLHASLADTEGAQDAFAHAIELAPDGVLTASVQEAYVGLIVAQLRQGDQQGARTRADAFYDRAPGSPTANYIQGLIAYRLSDFRTAHRFLVVAHSKAPDYLPVVLLLGATNYALGNYNQAENHLARFVRAVPGHARARVLLGAARLRTQGPDEALSNYRSAAALAADDQALLALIGTAAIEAGDFRAGIEYLRRAVDSDPESITARRQLAAAYLNHGAYDEAIRELRLLTDKEQSPAPALMLAIAHARKGELVKAQQICRELAVQNPEDLDVRYVLGTMQIANDDLTAARRTFEYMLTRAPDSVRARVRLAQLDLQAGKVEDARMALTKGLDLDPKSIPLMLALAQLEVGQGDESQAVAWLERARAADSNAVRPRALLVRYYLSVSQPAKALEVAEEAVAANQHDPLALSMLAESQLATGELLAAVQTLESLAEQSPSSPDAYTRLGRAQARANDLEGAIVSLEKALVLRPGYLPAQTALAQVLIRRRDLDAALAMSKEIATNQPSSATGFLLEGEVRMLQEDHSAAANAFAKAWIRDGSAKVTVRYAESLRLSGNTRRALEILREWLIKQGDDTLVRLVLAETYHNAGQTASAEREYTVVLRGQPDNVVALNNLASLLHGRDDQRALRYATKAHRLRPDLGAVADTLGWLLVDREIDLTRGRDLLRQAVQQSPSVPEIQFHLAVALSRSGESAEAKSIVAAALESQNEFPSREQAIALLNQLK